MVWKKDLAKLKQDLKQEEALAPPKPVPVKRNPKPEGPLDMEGEDAMFLAAMGKRPGRPSSGVPLEPPVASPSRPESVPMKEEGFLEAMGTLKGVKRIPEALPVQPNEQKPAEGLATPKPEKSPEIPAAVPEPMPVAEEPVAEEPKAGPVQMQLAAGMAIDVDGSLDLRGHSPQDAMERLKERILDGQVLGWRTLHAYLGSAELGAAFQEFLKCPEAQSIVRYAQAPVPMGGNQAWILYLAAPTGRENA